MSDREAIKYRCGNAEDRVKILRNGIDNMKVLYVIHGLGVGGAESIVTNYLVELKKRGIDAILLELYREDSFLYHVLDKEGVKIITLFPTLKSRNAAYKIRAYFGMLLFQKTKLNRVIEELNPDIIHFHTNLDYIDQLKMNYGRSFFTFHTAVKRAINFPTPKFKNALQHTTKKGMTIIAISENIKNDAIAEVGDCNIKVIPNGIDIERIRETRIDRSVFCREYGIPEDAFIVGHVGRFHPVKNHEKVIFIFNEIHKRNPNSYLVLVGDGDADRLSAIRTLCEQLNVKNYVLFLGMRNDATSIMSTFDCFLLPSFVEGFPLVLGEAQALGIRCLVTEAVPDEAVINDNCFRLDIKESDSLWADVALSDSCIGRGKDIMNIDVKRIVSEHIEEYEKALQ